MGTARLGDAGGGPYRDGRGSRPWPGPCSGSGPMRGPSAAELELEDLAGGGHRQRVAELDDPRVLVGGHVLLGPGDELLLGDLRARVEDHVRLDLLAVLRVGHADDGCE